MTTTRYNPRSVRNAMARISDGMTSFDEQPVSVSSTLFDLKSVYPVSRLRDRIQDVVGGSGVIQANGRYEVFTDAGANSEVTFRSQERARYIAGYDGIPGIATNLAVMPQGSQEIEWGNTDFLNGFVVGVDSESMYTRIYSGGVPSPKKRQGEWEYGRNVDMDPLNVSIYRTPYRWYSTGPYRLHVDHIGDDGKPTVLPLDLFTSLDPTLPITEDPNQPISIRVRNNGTALPMRAYVMGRSYSVQGDYNPNRRFIGDFRAAQTVGQTFVPLIAFRQKNNIYQSISSKLGGVGIISDRSLIWEIRIFETLTGGEGAWRAPRLTDGGTETAMEVNTDVTGLTNDGIQIWVGSPVAANQANNGGEARDLPGLELPTVPFGATIVLCARSVGSVAASVTSTFKVREEWVIAALSVTMFDGIINAFTAGVAAIV